MLFSQPASKFNSHYEKIQFHDEAAINDGAMFACSYSLIEVTDANVKAIAALVKKSVGSLPVGPRITRAASQSRIGLRLTSSPGDSNTPLSLGESWPIKATMQNRQVTQLWEPPPGRFTIPKADPSVEIPDGTEEPRPTYRRAPPLVPKNLFGCIVRAKH